MDFDKAFALLINHEGGYSNDPNDPGGETKFGISKREYPHLDIAGLTVEQAKDIYRADYWGKALCPELPDPLQFQVFDTAVNSGPRQATALLQRALGVDPDGVAGPRTRQALAENKDAAALAIRFLAARLRFMSGLPNWEHFGRGWSRRIATNLEEVVQ